MKLKNKIMTVGVAGMLGMGFTSCSDFLTIEPLNEIVQEKFWNSKGDVENIVMGCYSAMQSQTVIDRMIIWGESRSDDMVGGTNIANNEALSNIFKENINAKNTYTTWGEFYDIINRCNLVLLYAPEVAQIDPSYSESELNATRAEVSAIRDLMYFYLIRTFRDVPYTTEAYVDDTQQMDLPATSFDEVLNNLIADLESVRPYAVRKYQETKPLYQYARITRDCIDAMLCDMYLWKQDYANAVKYADYVLESKTNDFKNNSSSISMGEGSVSVSNNKLFEGYPLYSEKSLNMSGSSYGNVYGLLYSDDGCQENIFELIYSQDETMLSNGSVSYLYGNATTFPGIIKPADFISGDVTDQQFKVFKDKYDLRYYENISKVSSSIYGIGKYAYRDEYVMATNSEISMSGDRYTESNCYAPWIIYRTADVMLMKAEALAQMASSDPQTDEEKVRTDSLLRAAYELVNVIEKRSSIAGTYENISYDSYSSKTQMEELVLLERQRELMFEGKRWYDLVRKARRDGKTNFLITKVQQKGSDNAGVVQSKLAKMDGLYWPYNSDELKVNGNLVQNPSYGASSSSTDK